MKIITGHLIFFFFFCLRQVLRHARSFAAAHGLFVAALRLLSSCGGGFSLFSCRAQAPEHMGSVVYIVQALSLRHASSVVVAHGFSCSAACGILVPQPGIEPVSPALEGRFFTIGPPGKSLILKIKRRETSLAVQWLRLCLPMQGVRVWSLVGELGSHMPHGQETKT